MEKILGGDIKIALSKMHGKGTVLESNSLCRGFDKIVAVGGDGTVNAVANSFLKDPE